MMAGLGTDCVPKSFLFIRVQNWWRRELERGRNRLRVGRLQMMKQLTRGLRLLDNRDRGRWRRKEF